ncbi:unnamed protein product [Cylindrotheca closterium]|uniref:Vacuolar fusion protein MON1 homolog n=1 Tax=Cylindrotheca closterium TaxID=2856 RepID=A0AAD2FRH4_9STRA|nr:unnamed protein product [Cylindrotheca closterium]
MKGNNIIIMTEAGKPVFSTNDSEMEVGRQAALFQAIRTAVEGNNDALGLGELKSIHSGSLMIVFMEAGGITLVSMIEKGEEEGIVETEAFARIQLEHVYAQLIFSMTDHPQKILAQNPGFDLATMITATEKKLLNGILSKCGPDGNVGQFLTGSVETAFPIPHNLRNQASRALHSINVPNTVFAIMLVGDRLLSLVQSSFRPHQLRVSDLQLIINVVDQNTSLSSSELWIPMCLPRFNTSGFLYAYIRCLDETSQLKLILLSTHNTTEQFQLFHTASDRIRKDMDIPATHDTVLKIDTSSQDTPTSATKTDVAWFLAECSFDDSIEEGYVSIGKAQDQQLLLDAIQNSREPSSLEQLVERYVGKEEYLLQFVFRMDVKVRSESNQRGLLSQCISTPILLEDFPNAKSRRRVYIMYQKLGLRLRLGSATVESSMDALDMIALDDKGASDLSSFPTLTSTCPSIGLAESPPNVHGITYIVDGDEIFLGMNGRDFEFYMTIRNSVPIKKAAAIGTKLVRRLKADEKDLFLTNPLTWDVR